MKKLLRDWMEMDALDLVPRLTLVVLALRMGDPWIVRAPVLLLCACGLLFRDLHRNARFWWLVTAVLGTATAWRWYLPGGATYLTVYWCLALACGFTLRDPAAAVAINARVLIGLCFAFATLWKALVPEYATGAVFHHAFLTNDTLRPLARVLGGLSAEDLAENAARVRELAPHEVALHSSPRVILVAKIAAWWAWAIEAFLAVAFLWPGERAVTRARHAALVVFALTTFTLPTLAGFGWLLVAMALAQCGPRARVAYGVTALILAVAAVAA